VAILSSYSVRTAHTSERVFALWADPAGWPAWDPEVREVVFSGPAQVGARGRLRPASGPAASFTVTVFERDRRFTDASSLPGAKLVFAHEVVSEDAGSTVRVEVRIEGPLAPLWKRVLGRGLADAARSSVTGLLAHLDAA